MRTTRLRHKPGRLVAWVCSLQIAITKVASMLLQDPQAILLPSNDIPLPCPANDDLVTHSQLGRRGGHGSDRMPTTHSGPGFGSHYFIPKWSTHAPASSLLTSTTIQHTVSIQFVQSCSLAARGSALIAASRA